MATQNTDLIAAREAWATAVTDSVTANPELEAGETPSLARAIIGLRKQLALEFRALKQTILSGQFVDTK